MKKVFLKVLKDAKPGIDEKKRISEVSEKIISQIRENAKNLGANVEVVLGGSASRSTSMKGNHDLDFFIRFDSEKSINDHYKLLIAKTFDGFRIVHGTRDYFKGEYSGFSVEFVPSIKYDSPKKAENSADISFFHINYLKKKLEKNPELADEVLLLKQFLKANDLYGAESARSGFSGYACELMIIHFGSFYNLAEFFESSKPKIVIDIEKHYDGSEAALKAMNKSKVSGPLVIVDPLLPLRNAASCVSLDVFSQFVFKIRIFLRTRNACLFNIRGLKIALVKERSLRRGTKLIFFRLKESNDFDILKAKAKKRMNAISKKLDKEGFSIYSFGVTDDSYAYFEMESIKVSDAKKHFGPVVWCPAKHFSEFVSKWNKEGLSKPYAYGDRLAVDVKRDSDAKGLIKKMLAEYL
ncbi:MAG: CCA tRNA nucleotidyltransferase [Candidatus Nanoarchaeia archaeon]|nr:CCA tRNA nucleotidyltransferase [Candidatus Nanoarchaeia archaeon]